MHLTVSLSPIPTTVSHHKNFTKFTLSFPAKGFSADGWVYLPQISEGESEGLLFFLSYARPRGAQRRNKPQQDSNPDGQTSWITPNGG